MFYPNRRVKAFIRNVVIFTLDGYYHTTNNIFLFHRIRTLIFLERRFAKLSKTIAYK